MCRLTVANCPKCAKPQKAQAAAIEDSWKEGRLKIRCAACGNPFVAELPSELLEKARFLNCYGLTGGVSVNIEGCDIPVLKFREYDYDRLSVAEMQAEALKEVRQAECRFRLERRYGWGMTVLMTLILGFGIYCTLPFCAHPLCFRRPDWTPVTSSRGARTSMGRIVVRYSGGLDDFCRRHEKPLLPGSVDVKGLLLFPGKALSLPSQFPIFMGGSNRPTLDFFLRWIWALVLLVSYLHLIWFPNLLRRLTDLLPGWRSHRAAR